jgi:predicted ATP-dependent protease
VNPARFEVPADKLRWRCDPAQFEFDGTDSIASLQEFIGQDRAIRAIEFGLSMDRDGYNIYISGLAGTGKTSVAKTYIQKLIAERQGRGETYHVSDWCYIFNFANSDRPRAVELPKGKGKELRDDVSGLLEQLKRELAKAFSSDDYKAQRKAMVEESQSRQQAIFGKIRAEAQRQDFLIQMTPGGAALVPVKDGKGLSQDEFMALEETERKLYEGRRDEIRKALEEAFEQAQEIERSTMERLQKADLEVAEFTISKLFDVLFKKYEESGDIVKYLHDLKTYTLDKTDLFKEEQQKAPDTLSLTGLVAAREGDPFLPFSVNVFVDNSEGDGPPTVVETNPNYVNLFGKIERKFVFGGYVSDHTMLKPGAFQIANGGYLLLSATDVLTNPAVWPALKRVLKTKELAIEAPIEQLGLITPVGVRPHAIPMDVKVVLIGDAMLYQLLSTYDEDFWEIFKVKADFDYQVDRTEQHVQAYASFIAGCCEDCQLRHFDRSGVAAVIEHAARIVANQNKVSSRFAYIKELVEESEHYARKEDAKRVSAVHVNRALEERLFRHNLPDEHLREMIEDGTILIDTKGSVVGQVNGLSIFSLGDIMFGKPSRITCRTYLGKDGVINIEREVNLSGSSHDKGIMIMSGYIGSKFAQDHPLSLSRPASASNSRTVESTATARRAPSCMHCSRACQGFRCGRTWLSPVRWISAEKCSPSAA